MMALLHMCNTGHYYYFSDTVRTTTVPRRHSICDTTRGFRVAEIHLVFWGDGNDESRIFCGTEGETKTESRAVCIVITSYCTRGCS